MSINNIKDLYSKVQKKHEAIKAVSFATGVAFGSVKANWLCNSGGWSVPEKYIETVTTVLQNVIKNQ